MPANTPQRKTARLGMHPTPDEQADARIGPGTVGSVSQATKGQGDPRLEGLGPRQGSAAVRAGRS
jgi:hypothetical protein